MNTAQRTKQANMIDTIDSLLTSLDNGRTKSANANTEPGSIGGETSHPVKSVDDGTQAAREGFRSEENHSDVKEDQGAPGVDSTSPGTPGGQDSVQMNVGITSKATGEDSTNETGSAKGGKDDPGSSHPARTDNDSLDGMKYSSKYDELAALVQKTASLGNDLMAAIAAEAHDVTKNATKNPAPATKQAAPVAPAAPAAPAVDAKQAAQVGADLAAAVVTAPQYDKQAMDALVVDELASVIFRAESLAEKVAACCDSFIANVAKQASEEEGGDEPTEKKHSEGGEDAAKGGDSSGGGAPPVAGGGDSGGAPPAGGGAPDPMGGGDAGGGGDMQLLQMLLGGQNMGGGDAAAGMQGPGAGAPDPMGGAGGGAGAGGGDQMAMLMQILQDAGIDPAQLAGAMGGGGGGDPMGGGAPDPMGGAGGADPMGGGAPPMDPAAMGGAPKMGSYKFAHWAPKSAADRQKYAHMRSVIEEIVGRRV